MRDLWQDGRSPFCDVPTISMLHSDLLLTAVRHRWRIAGEVNWQPRTMVQFAPQKRKRLAKARAALDHGEARIRIPVCRTRDVNLARSLGTNLFKAEYHGIW